MKTEVDWAKKVEAAMSATLSDGEKGRELLAVVNERLDAEGGRSRVWSAMRYACDRGCGFEQWYELEVGVEGPPVWREDKTYIACPFTAGRCLRCSGLMTHVDFANDVIHKEPVALAQPFLRDRGVVPTKAAKVFRVPREVVRTPIYLDVDGAVKYATASHAFLMENIKGARDPRY